VSTAEAQAYAEEIDALCLETSAKLNKNVQDLFVDISRRLPQPVETTLGEVADLRADSKSGGGSGGKGGKGGKSGGGGDGGGCC
jgi:uncharacterized membrane protein YgcG